MKEENEFISSIVFTYKLFGAIFAVFVIILLPVPLYVYTDNGLYMLLLIITFPIGSALGYYWLNK